MKLSQTTKRAYLAMLACVLAPVPLYGCHQLLTRVGGVCVPSLHVFTFCCYAPFVIVWLRLIRQRVLNRHALAAMTCAALVMLAWLMVRTVKYEIAPALPVLSRYLWYAYYVGYTFVPTLLSLAVLHIGKRANETISRWWLLLLVGAGALSLMALTNDFHQLTFRFAGSFDFAATTDLDPYTRGPVFYLVWGWLGVLSVTAIVVALVRCGRSVRGVSLLAPLGTLVLGMVYLLVDVLAHDITRSFPYKTTEVTCIMAVAFMESLIALELFPTNDHYAELWRASSLRASLMDDRGKVVYAAQDAPHLDAAQVLRALSQPVALSADHELVARRVSGGVVCWIRDLTKTHAIQAGLEDLGDALAEENAVMVAENELAHEREAVLQRQRLYDEIALRTTRQTARLDALLEDPPADEDAFLEVMRRAAIEATHLKRCANLMLLGEAGRIEVRELALAMEESSFWLREAGVVVTLERGCDGSMAVGEALDAYERFQDLAEDMLAGTGPEQASWQVGPLGPQGAPCITCVMRRGDAS